VRLLACRLTPFESSWKKLYSTCGVRAMLARYAAQAGVAHNILAHRRRHFLARG
jgi:hypothetical protein